jgi:hypothetical protein
MQIQPKLAIYTQLDISSIVELLMCWSFSRVRWNKKINNNYKHFFTISIYNSSLGFSRSSSSSPSSLCKITFLFNNFFDFYFLHMHVSNKGDLFIVEITQFF